MLRLTEGDNNNWFTTNSDNIAFRIKIVLSESSLFLLTIENMNDSVIICDNMIIDAISMQNAKHQAIRVINRLSLLDNIRTHQVMLNIPNKWWKAQKSTYTGY